MAINTTTRQTTAFTSGNNFDFSFKVYEEGDVKVIRITTSTGAEEVLTITTHYTVTLNDDQNANPGGTVTLVSSGNPVNLGSGFNVVITSKVTPLQQTEITNQGGFFPEVINDVLDKAAILDQQQQAILDKTIRFPLTQTVGGLEITENAANRAGKVVQFDGSGDLTILGTVDGRDVSADGAKLDTIETNAKDDQTAAEIRALVESANDSNVFTDADHTKLDAIEAGATGDLNASEVKALYEGNSNTNAFTDALVSKLNNIEAGATGDQSASEIRTLVGSANDSNVFTDNDHSKLDGIETGATADQTSGDIKTLLQSDKLTHLELANDSVRVSQIQDSQITAAKLDPAAVITASEQASATPNDTSFLTSAAADARFFNVSTGDTIKDGDTFPDNDTTIATTAAINDRIIDLVDDVGGFVPIANETSFPTANPDAENGTGTIVSVKAASADLTPSGTTVTIANGAGTGNTVTITGVPSVIPSGYGFLVETTATSGNGSANPPRQYTFHRLVPIATQVSTVANKAVEIGRLGTADAVADMAILGTTDVVADMNMLATTDIVADMALLATTDVIADMALLAVSDVISDMNDLATSANITAMANCSNNITSINTASSNLNSINNFGDTYQVAANDPTTDGGGNSLAEGDLYFNTSANRLKVYDGSSWVNGVEISGSGAVTTGNTFTGDNRYNDGVKALFGTGSDLQIYHNGSNSFIDESSGTGRLIVRSSGLDIKTESSAETMALFNKDGAVELYFDNSKKFETVSAGCKFAHNVEIQTSGTKGIIHSGYNIIDQRFDTSNYDAFQFKNSAGTVDYCKIGYETAGGSPATSGKLRLQGVGALGSVILLANNKNAVFDQDGHFSMADNQAIKLGSSSDLQLYHDASHSYLEDAGTGELRLKSNLIRFQGANGEPLAVFEQDSATALYFDNSVKLNTNALGVRFIGHLRGIDNEKIQLGGSQDLQLYHDGTNSYLQNGTGVLYINNTGGNATNLIVKAQSDIELQPAAGETGVKAIANGAVELYYDNQKALKTTDNGILVYGHDGDSGHLYLYADDGDDLADRWVLRADASSSEFKLRNIVSGSWEDSIKAEGNGGVTLYFDNSRKYETQEVGANFFGRSVDCQLRLKTSDGTTRGNIYAYNDNSIAFLNAAGSYSFRANNDKTVTFFNHGVPNADSSYDLGTNTVRWRNVYADTLYGDGSNLTGLNTDLVSDSSPQLGGNLATNSNDILFADNDSAKFGAGTDLEIFHDPTSSDSNIKHQNENGHLRILSGVNGNGGIKLMNRTNNESYIECDSDAGVELYYDGSKKLETTTHGIKLGGASTIADSSADDLQIGLGSGHAGMTIYSGTSHVGAIYFGDGSGTNSYRGYWQYEHNVDRFVWGTAGSTRLVLNSSGHLLPGANNSYDLGESGTRWRNIYTNDLNLSNEGGANDVDGTWGSYTIQEGAEDLFLINKRNGKKYKFALMEVS